MQEYFDQISSRHRRRGRLVERGGKKKQISKESPKEKAEALLWCISVRSFVRTQCPSFCWQNWYVRSETSSPQQEGFRLCTHAKAAWGLMGKQTGQSKPATTANLGKPSNHFNFLTAKPMGQLQTTEGQSLRFVSGSTFNDGMNNSKRKTEKALVGGVCTTPYAPVYHPRTGPAVRQLVMDGLINVRDNEWVLFIVFGLSGPWPTERKKNGEAAFCKRCLHWEMANKLSNLIDTVQIMKLTCG